MHMATAEAPAVDGSHPPLSYLLLLFGSGFSVASFVVFHTFSLTDSPSFKKQEKTRKPARFVGYKIRAVKQKQEPCG
jgi:hypothetical protein